MSRRGAHCRGSAEEDDQIMRKFNVQMCKRKVCNVYDTIFHLFVNMFWHSPLLWNVHYFTFSMKCWSLPNFFNREILLVMRETELWICTYACDAGLPGTLHVVLLKWTMSILMARFNNVKNICVLKDFICQGGRPKNSRTCMLVGWGSRHFAAEAMELKVPDKVLICYFVLPSL